MKLVTFEDHRGRAIGCIDDGGTLRDVSDVVGGRTCMNGLIACADRLLPEVRGALETGRLKAVGGALVVDRAAADHRRDNISKYRDISMYLQRGPASLCLGHDICRPVPPPVPEEAV